MILSIAYISGAPWNDTVISISRVDELVKGAARRARCAKKRQELYSEVQMLLSTQGGTLVPAFGQDVAAIRDKVGVGEKIGGGWEMDGGHFLPRGTADGCAPFLFAR